MSKMKELDEIAQGVADVTMELMYDSVDWQLSDFPQDGDEYSAIHANVMFRAIEKMYGSKYKKGHYENPLEQLPGIYGYRNEVKLQTKNDT